MTHVQTLIHGKHVIPVNGDEQTLVNFSIAVQDGRILDILSTSDAKITYTSDSIYNYDHHIIIPGLINTHTHATMTLFRGLANDLHLMDWLQNHIWPAEQKWVNEDFVEIGTKLAIAEMIRGGVTCFNDMYFFALDDARQDDQDQQNRQPRPDLDDALSDEVDETAEVSLKRADENADHGRAGGQ